MAGNPAYYCPRCGTQLSAGAQFCSSCGQALTSPPQTAPLPAQPPAPAASPTPAPAPPPSGYAYTQPVPVRASSNSTAIVLLVVFLGVLVIGGALGIGLLVMKGRTASTPDSPSVASTPTGETPASPGPAATSPGAETPGATPPRTGVIPPPSEPLEPPASPPSRPARVAVPNVVGLSKADAERSLEATGGFQPNYNPARYSDRYGTGTIIAQSPAPGTIAESGDAVYLVESLGLSAPTPPPPPPPSRRRTGGGSYLLPGSDRHYLHGGELYGLSNWQLTLARNEIYARHGRPFDNPNIRAYFLNQPWYSPDSSFTESRLSKVERTNAEFIRDWQVEKFGRAATGP